MLNPHFGIGQKDLDAARIFYEPLAALDPDGQPVPILAAQIPSLKNGDVAADGRSVTWRLKRNVTWHDGKPFTADDVVFNWEYASDPAAATVSMGYYKEVKRVERIDAHTVRVVFHEPTPVWARPFVGTGWSFPSISSTPFAAPSRATHRRTSSRSARALTGSSTSSRAIWCAAKSIRTTTSRTARTSTPSK